MTEALAAHARPSAVGTQPGSRPLSLFESFFTLSSTTIWLTAHVDGTIDVGTLRAAWSLLRQAHPVLTARLVPGSAELMPGVPGWDLILPALPAGGGATPPDEPPLRVHEDEQPFPRPFTSRDPIALVDVALSGQKTLVSLAVHHAIADGRLALHWNRELWSYYTDLLEGRHPVIEPTPVPKSPEALLAERGVTKVKVVVNRAELATPTTGLSKLDPNSKTHAERIVLSAAATTNLRARAKAQGQTVHGLVTGAVAVATRRFLPTTGDHEVDLVVNSPVDIRGRIDPPVPVWGGTNVLGIANSVVAVHPGSDPAAVGAEVIRQLTDDMEAGVVHQSFLHMMDNFSKEQPKAPQIVTTNVGVLEPIPTPDGVVITEIQGALEADWVPVVAMIEAMGQTADHPALAGSAHIILTYAGRLSVDVITPLSPERAREYADTLEALLVGLAEPGAAAV